MDRLAGGFGTVFDASRQTTVGSYWPYATTLFDFVRRAMPFNAPQSLTPDEVYAVSAYVLYLNELVAEDARLDAAVAAENRNAQPGPFRQRLPPAPRSRRRNRRRSNCENAKENMMIVDLRTYTMVPGRS